MMKLLVQWYSIIILVLVSSIFSYTHALEIPVQSDPEFVAALDWMFSYGLTKYTSPKEFKSEDFVTREQAAKFYSQFAVNILYKVIDMTKYCEFSDLNNADPSLKNSILTSCLLHLFNGKQNKFMPLQKLTKAEAITVLIRAIDKQQEENITPWYKNYYTRALDLKLTKETDISKLELPITRYEMALLLYRASQKK